MNDYTVEVVWYPNANARAEDFCVNETEEERIQQKRVPNNADDAEDRKCLNEVRSGSQVSILQSDAKWGRRDRVSFCRLRG